MRKSFKQQVSYWYYAPDIIDIQRARIMHLEKQIQVMWDTIRPYGIVYDHVMEAVRKEKRT